MLLKLTLCSLCGDSTKLSLFSFSFSAKNFPWRLNGSTGLHHSLNTHRLNHTPFFFLSIYHSHFTFFCFLYCIFFNLHQPGLIYSYSPSILLFPFKVSHFFFFLIAFMGSSRKIAGLHQQLLGMFQFLTLIFSSRFFFFLKRKRC